MRQQASKRPARRRRGGEDFDLGFTPPRAAQAVANIRAQALADALRSIPSGKVATYGQVAAAAGYPGYHRAVAGMLRNMAPDEYPWHRVVGAGGAIKAPGSAAAEQRLRLRSEGVGFRGKRVDLHRHQYTLPFD